MHIGKPWSLGLWAIGAISIACAGAISFEAWQEESQQPEVLSCSEDGNCGTGYVCVGGLCKPGCRTKEDCDKSHACIHQVCQPACSQDEDCVGDYLCASVPGAQADTPKTCQAGCRVHGNGQSSCQEGYVCEGAQDGLLGFCQAGCRGDEGCGTGYICNQGSCQPGCRLDNPAKSCGDGSGYACVVGAGSVGTCKPGCREDRHCPGEFGSPDNQLCLGLETPAERLGVCELGCRIDSGEGMTTDSCGAEHVCRGNSSQTAGVGLCMPGWCRVADTTSCSEGQVCVGYGGNFHPGTPGFCRPACTVNVTGCATRHRCIGFENQRTGAAGSCQRECRGTETAITRDSACDEGDICTGTPSVCQPGCRTVANTAKLCLPGQRCESNNRCRNNTF